MSLTALWWVRPWSGPMEEKSSTAVTTQWSIMVLEPEAPVPVEASTGIRWFVSRLVGRGRLKKRK